MMLIITMVTIMNSNLPGLFLHSSHNPQRLRPGSAHFHLSYRINQLQFWEHISWSVCNMIWGKLWRLPGCMYLPWKIAKFITGRASNHILASIWNVEQVPSFWWMNNSIECSELVWMNTFLFQSSIQSCLAGSPYMSALTKFINIANTVRPPSLMVYFVKATTMSTPTIQMFYIPFPSLQIKREL